MSFLAFIQSEDYQTLQQQSNLATRVESIQARLAEPSCEFEETQTLRGELAGIGRVFAEIEKMAAEELEPGSTEGAELTDFAGYRNVYRVRRRKA